MKYHTKFKSVFVGKDREDEVWLDVEHTVIKGCPGDNITPGTPDFIEVDKVVLRFGSVELDLTPFTETLAKELTDDELTKFPTDG